MFTFVLAAAVRILRGIDIGNMDSSAFKRGARPRALSVARLAIIAPTRREENSDLPTIEEPFDTVVTRSNTGLASAIELPITCNTVAV